MLPQVRVEGPPSVPRLSRGAGPVEWPDSDTQALGRPSGGCKRYRPYMRRGDRTQGRPPYEAVFTTPPSTILGALVEWLVTVVLFSAFALGGPVVAPLLGKAGNFKPVVSFGKGELLGLALAIFAAAAARCLSLRSNVALRGLSTAGLVLVSVAIALVWTDGYRLQTHESHELALPGGHVLGVSWVLLGLALLCGAAAEVAYSLSLRRAAVKAPGGSYYGP